MTAPPKRGLGFWLLLAGGSTLGCCLLSFVGVALLGLSASDEAAAPSVAAATTGADDDFVYHSPNGLHFIAASSVVAEGVAVTLAGEWREDHRNIILRMKDDGEYELSESGAVLVGEKISNATAYGSRTSERGRWALQDSVLTLTPQRRQMGGSVNLRRLENEDLAVDEARTWSIEGVTLRYTPHDGSGDRERPGLRVRGPAPPWYYPSGEMNWTLRSAPWSGD